MRPPLDVAAGDRPGPRTVGPITQTDIVRFAGASGDFNPLHHDEAFARMAGFPSVISMGQLQAGLLAGWLTDWCGVEHLHEYAVRFQAPVAVGDVLELGGEVTRVDAVTDGAVATLDLWVTRDGTAVVTGSAVVRVLP